MAFLEDYFNVIEAGHRLGIHPETVKRLCRQKDLPAVKVHNTWLIDREILNNFAGTYVSRRGAKKRLI
ncbi:helix-turn-helix domain-containing protein [Chloroflexota bacterium]